jgi:hypothetical protein
LEIVAAHFVDGDGETALIMDEPGSPAFPALAQAVDAVKKYAREN